MCERRSPDPSIFGRCTFSAGTLSLLNHSWSSSPTDTSHGDPSSKTNRWDPSTNTSHGWNSDRQSRKYSQHKDREYLGGLRCSYLQAEASEWAQIGRVPDCQSICHPSWPSTCAQTIELATRKWTLHQLVLARIHLNALFRCAHWPG